MLTFETCYYFSGDDEFKTLPTNFVDRSLDLANRSNYVLANVTIPCIYVGSQSSSVDLNNEVDGFVLTDEPTDRPNEELDYTSNDTL